MKKKLFTSLLSVGIAATLCLSSGLMVQAESDTHAQDEVHVETGVSIARAGCSKCGGQRLLECRKSRYYSYDYTHSFGNCTVIVYESPYRGYVCQSCGDVATTELGLDPSARHPCVEYHSSCGKGWTDTGDCRDGYPY